MWKLFQFKGDFIDEDQASIWQFDHTLLFSYLDLLDEALVRKRFTRINECPRLIKNNASKGGKVDLGLCLCNKLGLIVLSN